MIETITILGGHGKTGEPEPLERIDLQMGDVVSIVGPTAPARPPSSTTSSCSPTPTRPPAGAILINGEPPPEEYRDDPSRNPIALITQHTTFLSDLPVDEFLDDPARIRARSGKHSDEHDRATRSTSPTSSPASRSR